MKTLVSLIFMLIAGITGCGSSPAAVLVLSPNGVYVPKVSLAVAVTDPDASGKTIIVTSPQVVTTAIAWPADRDFRCEKGGYITFTGAGALTGLKESKPEWFGSNTAPGSTNMTAGINNAFLAGSTIILSDTYFTTGVDLPSDRTIIFKQGAQLKLANGSNRPVLQNVHWQSNVDKNITIYDLNIDGNDANQVHHTTSGIYSGEYVSGIRFFGVTNLKLIRPTINHAKTFAIWVANIVNLVVESPVFNQTVTGTPANQDGLHMNGPITGAYVTNVRGSTYDDMVALNADDGALGSTVTAGAITDVNIDGVVGSDCLNGVRILSVANRIDHISIKNLLGSYLDTAVNIGPYGMGAGNIGSISIDTVNVNCHDNLLSGSEFARIVVDGAIDSLTLRNITVDKPADNRSTVWFLPAANVASFTLDGFHIIEASTSTAASTPHIIFNGYVPLVNIANVQWNRDTALTASGWLVYVDGVSGAQFPHTVRKMHLSQIAVNGLQNVVRVLTGGIDSYVINGLTEYTRSTTGNAGTLRVDNTSTISKLRADTYNGDAEFLVNLASGASLLDYGGTAHKSHILAFGGSQTIPITTFTAMAYGSSGTYGQDTYGEFNSTTHVFTPHMNGKYTITAAASFPTGATTDTETMAVYVNGAPNYQIAFQTRGTTEDSLLVGSVTMDINAGDAVDVRIYRTVAGAVNVSGPTNYLKIDQVP